MRENIYDLVPVAQDDIRALPILPKVQYSEFMQLVYAARDGKRVAWHFYEEHAALQALLLQLSANLLAVVEGPYTEAEQKWMTVQRKQIAVLVDLAQREKQLTEKQRELQYVVSAITELEQARLNHARVTTRLAAIKTKLAHKRRELAVFESIAEHLTKRTEEQ